MIFSFIFFLYVNIYFIIHEKYSKSKKIFIAEISFLWYNGLNIL